MGFKVVKFGGSSLADASQFKKVKAIMQSDPERRFIVPSAPGKRTPKDEKITDMLYTCHTLASEGQSFNDVFDSIAQRYTEIARECSLALDIRPYLEKVRADIAAGESRDYAASRGEYLNGLLLADFLGWEFVDAAQLIRFDENGRLNAPVTDEQTAKRLSGKERCVIPGFYGAMPDGSIKTFSRGGSDITGALVAKGTGADVYENWTDVSGFLMADPRIVSDPKPINFVTYRELRELAYMGAEVLHEDSIFPVCQACIPINIKNTNDPGAIGTFIVPDSEQLDRPYSITGIAGRKGFTVIAIEKNNMNAETGFGRKVLEVLDEHGVSFEHMPSSIDTLSLVVDDKFIKSKQKQIVDEIMNRCNPDTVEVHDNMALIATVGKGMISSVGISARLFRALADAKVNVRMIDQGSSEMNIIVGVECDDFAAAVTAIYTAFTK